MRVRAVLFDAEGVLFDPAESVGRTYSEAAREHGVRLPAWRLEDAFRRVIMRMPERVFPDATPAETEAHERSWWRECVRQTFQAADSTVRFDDFDALFDELYEAFAMGQAWTMRTGCLESLSALRDRGIALGVVSNFDHRLPTVLEDLGIAELLDTIAIPSRCGSAKPDPEIFLSALSVLGVDPPEAVFVGHDPVRDLAGASAAGLVPLVLPRAEGLGALPARIERIANLGA